MSYNTVKNSFSGGIQVDAAEDGDRHLVTRNVVVNTSNGPDYTVNCPSDVTFNTSKFVGRPGHSAARSLRP